MEASTDSRAAFRILIINPNSSVLMTDALKPLVSSLDYSNTEYAYFTAPTGPPSINGWADCEASARASLPALLPLLPAHDAFLVACYSPHPLTAQLRAALAPARKPVLGILEASTTAAVNALGERERFGVVSTGAVWEELAGRRVAEFLGSEAPQGPAAGSSAPPAADLPGRPNGSAPFRSPVFAGVETTGLTAGELHEAPQAEVRRRVQEAARRLAAGGGGGAVRAVVLGCAGMAGMEAWVREAVGDGVAVVDGVRAGVAALQGSLRCGF